MRAWMIIAATLGLSACSGLPDQITRYPDPTYYRPVTVEALAQGIRLKSLASDSNIEVTATVDGRFARQIVIDLRTGQGQVVSRRDGDCIQVLLPLGVKQDAFNTGRYVIRGFYRDIYMDKGGFKYEQNEYEPACGAAYLFARTIERAP